MRKFLHPAKTFFAALIYRFSHFQPSLIFNLIFLTLSGFGLLSFSQPAQAEAQQRCWLVQASAVAMYYHSDFDYQPGLGMQLAMGRQWHPALAVILKLSHARPRQSFLWLGETKALKTAWYRSQIALRLCLPVRAKSGFQFFADLQAGWVYLHPHALALNGGAQGTIFLAPENEMHFSPGGAGGLSYRCTKHTSVFLLIEMSWLKIATRQLNTNYTRSAWKPYQQLGAGVRVRF